MADGKKKKKKMRKIILSVVVLISMVHEAFAVGNFGEALQNGKYSTHARVFYFDRDFDGTKPRAKALAASAIMKYESADYLGLKFGLAYYGSHRLGDFYSREEGKGTSILARDGNDITLLGEAYLQYNIANTMFKLGRQQLSTPLIQNHDLRILPSVYEAVVLRNKDIANTTLELGYVRAYTGFGSKENEFLDFNSSWGKDGLAYLYLANNTVEDLSIKAQYVAALSDEDKAGATINIKDYRYADLKYDLKAVGENTYIKAQYGGNAYDSGGDSLMVGVKAGTTVGKFDLVLLGNKISNNNFKAVRSGPMYADYQQGYGKYEPSTALGAQATVKPLTGLSFRVAYVVVSADEGNTIDDYTETNLDLKYKLNSYSKIRVRYSIKDQTEQSAVADRDDFRIIYYLNF